MSAVHSVCLTLCFTCVAVGIITVLIPQKRTRRIMSFVAGLFFISTLVTALSDLAIRPELNIMKTEDIVLPTYSDEEYQSTAAQMTTDNLTKALDEILQNEGIKANDIKLTLKISDEGRISVVRAVIYISEDIRDKTAKIESIIYRNISKEPEIYVIGEESHEVAG